MCVDPSSWSIGNCRSKLRSICPPPSESRRHPRRRALKALKAPRAKVEALDAVISRETCSVVHQMMTVDGGGGLMTVDGGG